MATRPIKNVLVVGATGAIGPYVVKALQNHPQQYNVSIITRPSSYDKCRSLFENVKVFAVDYTSPSIVTAKFQAAFQGQDAIVSTLPTATNVQPIIIDAAVASGCIRRFIPTEFGMDTSDRDALEKYLPVVAHKNEVVQKLRQHEAKMSWSAICVGAFFDWAFSAPGLLGWNVPARSAMIFDGGNVEFEASNLSRIGHAVANVLSSTPSPGFSDGSGKDVPMLQLTANKYVYVNSFTTTQNHVLAWLEAEVGEKFSLQQINASDFGADGAARTRNSMPGFVPKHNSDYPDGSLENIVASMYGYGGLNNFGKRGLWNYALDLPQEDLESTMKRAVPKAI